MGTVAPEPGGLERFVIAQGPVWETVMAELRAGRKESHWSWFVFPQLAGLGASEMSRRFAIASLAEAQAYLAHPVLGDRLRTVARILLAVAGRTAVEILGETDAKKLRSCMTLFHHADPDEPLFPAVMDRFFAGETDALTEAILREEPDPGP